MGVNPLQQGYTSCGSVRIEKKALDGEPALTDGMYTAKLINGTVLKFSADAEIAKGTVGINEAGETLIFYGNLINVQGSDKDDNISLFNCRECEVNIEGGGADKVVLFNFGGYGFNTVAQGENDVTYIKIPKKESDFGYWRVAGSNIFSDYDYNRPSGL